MDKIEELEKRIIFYRNCIKKIEEEYYEWFKYKSYFDYGFGIRKIIDNYWNREMCKGRQRLYCKINQCNQKVNKLKHLTK